METEQTSSERCQKGPELFVLARLSIGYEEEGSPCSTHEC